MNIQNETKPKERILSAAWRLFYEQGINAVGVDLVSATADVSKRTLYRHFPSKEILVAACLEDRGTFAIGMYMTPDPTDAAAGILYPFRVLKEHAKSARFHGCPFMNASIELKDADKPAHATAKTLKDHLRAYFAKQARTGNASEPAVLAEQLTLLFDGCNAWIVMHGSFPKSTFKAVVALMRNQGIACSGL